MNVYQKLNDARDKFHKTPIKKSGANTFAKYTYFELADFLMPALAIFKDVGLSPIISFGIETATMKIVNTEDPKEFIEITSPMSDASLKGCHAVQNLGAVQTYLRRYLWATALELVEHDVVDASEGKAKPVEQKQNAVSKNNEKIAALLKEGTEALDNSLEQFKAWFGSLNAEERELFKEPAFAELRNKFHAAKKLADAFPKEREPGEEG